jgi:hypothetical protein
MRYSLEIVPQKRNAQDTRVHSGWDDRGHHHPDDSHWNGTPLGADYPEVRAVWYERAKVNLLMKNYADARDDAERAATLPDTQGVILDLQVYALLGQIYGRLGNQETSNKLWRFEPRSSGARSRKAMNHWNASCQPMHQVFRPTLEEK